MPQTKPDTKLKDTFCILPWVHMYVDPTGDAFPCCIRNPSAPSLGSIKTQKIEEVWNAEPIRQFRLDLLAGKARPETCSGCYAREKVEGLSHRMEFLKEFDHLVKPSIEQMGTDGAVAQPRWALLDFRLSNVCNFKCRTCGPEYSSSMAAEYKAMGLPIEGKSYSSAGRRRLFEFYLQNVDSLERIYFAGGEPLIIPEHYQLIDRLCDRKRFDVTLSYNTNLSTLVHAGRDVIEDWKRFKHVLIWPSIDHFGAKAEYMRKGASWMKIKENLMRLRREAPHVFIKPTITISIFNVMSLSEVLDVLIAEEVLRSASSGEFAFNLVREPEHFNISVLPEDFRMKATENILKFIDTNRHGFVRSQFDLILSELQRSKSSDKWNTFLETTRAVDRFRKEDFFSVFPEFEAWRTYAAS